MVKESHNNLPDRTQVYPYKVPEGYFETLKTDVLRQIKEQEKEQPPVVRPKHWYQRIAPYLYTAAAVVAAFLVIYFFPDREQVEPYTSSLETASPEVYDAFLLEETADDYWGAAFFDASMEEEQGQIKSNI